MIVTYVPGSKDELKPGAKIFIGAAAKKEPLKVFDPSPVTGKPIQLLDGRYGPYLNDSETNASLPKGASVEELTFNEALDLLAARAALGPPKKKRAKAAAPKSDNGAPKKKSATKRRPAGAAAAKSTKKKAT